MAKMLHKRLATITYMSSESENPYTILCDFIKEILPLGLDLIQLRHIPNFGRLIEKLNIPSQEKGQYYTCVLCSCSSFSGQATV